jgi:hypothetical protein
MNPDILRRQLEDVLTEFEDRRYLGMSMIGKCPRFLYDMMVNGRSSPNLQTKRYCHEGYVHEADILERMCLAGLDVRDHGKELVAPFDERFRGHIDGRLDDWLIEIKSVDDNRFSQVIQRGAFFEHMDQCQMYMRYGGFQQSLIIYKCRNTGELYFYTLRRSEEHGQRLEQKAKDVLAAVDGQKPPVCGCGHCR